MKSSFQKLLNMAKRLRSEKGCPWDRAQTIESLLKGITEESDEVRQAIESGDYSNLREELGDLLFQIVLMAEIASERRLFTLKEVMDDIAKKLIRRHSWVFGKDKVLTSKDAVKQWKKNKRCEKHA